VGLSAVVALEVATRAATDSEGTPRADPPDGAREPRVGSRAHRERIAVEAWTSSVATHGGLVHATIRARPAARRSTMVDLPAQSRASHHRVCFCVAVTSTFRVLYVLVVIEHHSRRLIHFSVTAHPTAQWTRQQLPEAVGYEERYKYLLHDRDSIFSAEVDEFIRRLGLRVLRARREVQKRIPFVNVSWVPFAANVWTGSFRSRKRICGRR